MHISQHTSCMSLAAPHLVLVDDHGLFRMGLEQMLAVRWPQARFQQAVSWSGALALLKALWPVDPPDALLLDVGLPDADALPRLNELRAVAPTLPVLVMSADSRPERVALARDAGVQGWLSKSVSPELIVSSVAEVLGGRLVFAGLGYEALSCTPTVVPALMTTSEPLALTDLQRQILGLLGLEIPNKAIARQLGLSEMDVRVQVSWLTDMLEASSRREAYQRAVQRGLIDP